MKKRRLFIILPILLMASCTISTTPNTTVPNTTVPNTTVPNTTVPNTTVPSTTSTTSVIIDNPNKYNGYYNSINTELTGDLFINQLTTIVNKDYVKFSYSKDWEILEASDVDLNKPGYVRCLYTGKSMLIPTDGSSRNWNREHVWPNSHGFSSDSYAAYTDAHHLRATESNINNTRGDLDFDEVENHTGVISSDNYGNKWISNVCFEPRDEVKGDIARMLFYMVVKYNDNSLDLMLVNETTSSATPKLGFLDTLIKWHYEDPVSESEIYRNDVVYSYQKNRNPFIDHPEYVSFAFDSDYADLTINSGRVNNVINLIDSLDNTTINREFILEAKEQFDLLNENEKTYVYNYYKLDSLLSDLSDSNDSNNDNYAFMVDFSNSGLPASTGGYILNETFTINGKTFFASSYNNDANGLKIGHNKNDFTLTQFGLEELGSYIEEKYITKNVKKLSITVNKTFGTVNKWYVFFTEENSTEYKFISSGTQFTNIDAELDTKKNGHFTIVITGTKARICFDQYKVYTE
ncbi:MAG: endonuclease I family protein [Anaeroplasma sp.]